MEFPFRKMKINGAANVFWALFLNRIQETLAQSLPRFVRTPESQFSNLPNIGYPWEPSYLQLQLNGFPPLRMHYLDLGEWQVLSPTLKLNWSLNIWTHASYWIQFFLLNGFSTFVYKQVIIVNLVDKILIKHSRKWVSFSISRSQNGPRNHFTTSRDARLVFLVQKNDPDFAEGWLQGRGTRPDRIWQVGQANWPEGVQPRTSRCFCSSTCSVTRPQSEITRVRLRVSLTKEEWKRW